MTGTSFDDDPLTNLNERMRSFEQQEQVRRFTQTVAAQVQAFKQSVPDYDQALQHVMNTRREELRAMGTAEAEIPHVIDAESLYLARTAMEAGKNPGEALYQMARQRGFQGRGNDADDILRDDGDDEGAAHASHTRDPSGDVLQQALAEAYGRGRK